MKTNKFHSAARRASWGAGLALAAIMAASGVNAFAQFTAGNLVVNRFGDGIAPLGANGTNIFLDQYTTSGTPVNSTAIPTTGASQLVGTGNSTTEGSLFLNPYGTNLIFAGYNAPPSVSSPATGTPVNFPRAVAAVDYNGNYILITNSVTAFTGGNIRSATTDGNTNYWAAGSVMGIGYLGLGPTNITCVPGNSVNNRVIQVVGGNLYFTTGSGTHGIYKITGTPTNTGNAASIVINTTTLGSTSPYGFAFDPWMATCYIADSDTNTTSAGFGGIEKWIYNGSAWVYQYSITPPIAIQSVYYLAVDWTTMPATIYATTATNLFKVQDTAGTNAAGVNIATVAANEAFRGVAFAPSSSGLPAAAPTITGIGTATSAGVTPASAVTNNGGSTITFALTGTTGSPIASNFWYKISGGTTNLIGGAIANTLTLANLVPTNQAGYFCVLSNASGSATSSVVSLTVNATPVISSISPASATVDAGQFVTFTLTTGSYPTASNFWYKVGSPDTLILNGAQTSGSFASGATTTTLSLSNVLGGDTASYYAVLTNIYGSATSSLASLTVLNDPIIVAGPSSAFGLIHETAPFAVTVAGTTPLSYQWWFSDLNGDLIAQVNNGPQGDGSGFAGATSSTLTFTNLQPADPTNFVVVVTNVYGAVTSSVATLYSVANTAILTFWDFNGSQFTNWPASLNCFYTPAPYLGAGTAQAVGYANVPVYPPNPALLTASPFSGSVDTGGDGPGVDPYNINPPPPSYFYPGDQPASLDFSWGTDLYPANSTPANNVISNKQSGVQFNVSTLGAKNITVAYDSRVSATASEYERLQYTTNGTDWVDYPISSTFAGVGTTFEPYSYSLVGFPGAANNPNFGIRIVTELENTATYGGYNDNNGTENKYFGGSVYPTTNFIGTANTYGSGGTVTYDIVGIFGTAITNASYNPPTISFTTPTPLGPTSGTNMIDTNTIVLPFTVGSAVTPPGSLVVNAQTLFTPNQYNISPNLVLGGSGANRTLTISFPSASTVPDPVDAAPIMVTVTDSNGDSTATWFDLVAVSIYPPPTNSLTGLAATNLLANTSLAIPFTVGSASTPIGSLTYSVASDNNTLIPSANIVVTGVGTYTPTLTITPAANQLGVALISVAVTDNNSTESHTTTANIAVMVRPNTNVVAIDYFDYDGSGALDTLGSGFWNHLSGNFGQMQVGSGVVRVDTPDNTENLQTPLLGGPYLTNSAAILYASFTVNMNPGAMPIINGSYITAFNDGTGLSGTADVNGLLVAATNGAAPGNYRLGVANIFGSTALAPTVMFPQDLVPNTTNVVVLSLVVSNGFSTLWVNPSSQSSPSVMNNSTVSGALALTNYNIVNFELRESGANSGIVSVGYLKVGTTFDSVFPSLYVQSIGTNAVLTWSDSTLGIQSTTNLLTPFTDVSGATPPYTNNASTNLTRYFRFGR